jgi:hypothetical protein
MPLPFHSQIQSLVPTGTAPLSIVSTTQVDNLNADFLDGQHGSYYLNAGNLNAGTLPADRLSGTYTISISGYAAAVVVSDTRNAATTPQTIDRGVVFDFKANTSNGLDDGGNYFGLLTFRQYGTGTDWTGGSSHQLGFTDNGNVWQRSGSNTTWGSWKKLWDDANDGAGSGLDADLLDGQHGSYYAAAASLANYLPLTGGTLTGALNGISAYFSGNIGAGVSPTYRIQSDAPAMLNRTAFGVLDINSNGSPNFIKIQTAIPFSYGAQAYTVHIKGFAYDSSQTVDLAICWHQYADTFYATAITSKGSFAPTVRLARESGNVVICLTWSGKYWPKLYVESVHNYDLQAYSTGWTWVDADITGDKVVTLSYKNDWGGGMTKDTSGNLTVGGNLTTNGNLTVRINRLFANVNGVGVGTTGIFADFQVQRSTNARLEIDSSSTGISYQVVDNARTGYLQNVTIASQHLWFNGLTEAMRLNSTGLGVGVSPSYKLDVNGVINTNSEIYATGGRLALYRVAGASYVDYASGQDLIFRTVTSAGGAGPSELMRLSSAGALNTVGAITQNGNQVLHAGNYNSYVLAASGTAASLSIGGSAVSSTTQSKSDSSTSIATTAFSKWLFATFGTGGTTDWNHVSNTMPGTGTTLLRGSDTNGFGPSQYYHPVNFEYAGTGGTGNVTQLAVAYGLEGNDLRMRGRYSGTWTSWVQFLNSSNYNSYAPTLTGTGASGTWGISISGSAAQLNGQAASFYQNAGNLNAGTLPSARLSGTYTIDIAGAASSGSRLGLWDGTTYITGSNTISGTGGRGVNLAPNTYVKQISFEFKNTSFASMGGNYGGLITIAPWDGTAVSQGDPNYQLLFSASAANSTSNPVLRLRAGIDAGWGAWATLIHDANFSTAIPNSGATAGTYNNVTVNAKGIVTGGSNVSYLTGNQSITLSGDVSGSGTTAITATIGAGAVTYAKIQNVAISSVLGNSSASVAQAPQALSMATLAGMLSGQTMNIAGSSSSCTGNAATATTATNSTQLNGQAASYYENRDTTAVSISAGTLTLTRAAGNLTATIGGRVVAWCHFDGTPPSATTLNANFNVSSVTKNGTGDYTVNFTNAIGNTTYVVAGTAQLDAPSPGQNVNNVFLAVPRRSGAQASGSCRVVCEYPSGLSLWDSVIVRVAFIAA